MAFRYEMIAATDIGNARSVNEDSLRSTGANSTGDNNTGDRLIYFNPKWLHQKLDNNPRYRQRFADRAHRQIRLLDGQDVTDR